MQNLPVHVINAGAKRESGKKAQMGNIAAAKVREGEGAEGGRDGLRGRARSHSRAPPRADRP